MADVKALAEQLVGLTVKEVQELADVLKADYGIEPAAAAVVVAAGDGGGAAAAEEKTAFDVILKSGGASKLNVVKIVKDLTGLGLKLDSCEAQSAGPSLLGERSECEHTCLDP